MHNRVDAAVGLTHGVLLRREGLLDEAEVAFRKALSLDPEEAAALSNLARLYRSEGRRDEARALLAQIKEKLE